MLCVVGRQARQKFDRNISGSITILSAMAMVGLVAVAAFAIDFGSLYLQRRQAQSAVDLAAMAAASDVANADAAARATLASNGVAGIKAITIDGGRYEANSGISAAARFTTPAAASNAVRIAIRIDGKTYFAKAFRRDPFVIEVTGTAAAANQATFSLGSRLLAIRGGVPNAILGALLGSSINLTAMDYDGLANADIGLAKLIPAIATEANLSAATFSDVLASSITAGQLFEAMATVAENRSGGTSSSVILRKLAAQSAGSTTAIPLSRLIDAGPFSTAQLSQTSAPFDAKVSAMDLVSAASSIANGNQQVSANLGATIPGLAKVTVDLAVGEPVQQSSWVRVGSEGATLRTSQTRVRIMAEINGGGLLSGVKVRLPIVINAASAEARLAAVSCRSDGPSVTIAAKPALAEAWIGDTGTGRIDNFAQALTPGPSRIVDTALLRVSAQAHLAIANTTETEVVFTQADVDAQRRKTVGTVDITESLVSSLLGDVRLQANILGLSLITPTLLETLVGALLQSVTAPLDALVAGILETAGVHLGEADVGVHDIRCHGAVLAG